MTLADLENLADAGKLKREPPNQDELDGLLKLGEAKFQDAQIVASRSKADSIWRTAPRMRSHWLLSVGTAIDPTRGTSSFNVWNTRWVYRAISGECWTRLTGLATRPTMVATFR